MRKVEAEMGKEAGNSRRDNRMRKPTASARHITMAVGITTVAVCAVIIAAAAFAIYGVPVSTWIPSDLEPDRNAMDGTLHMVDSEDVDEGEFWVLLNQLPTIEEGSRECNLEFENPEENHYGARISLHLKSSGKKIGGTDRVDPGTYVETVKLSRSLIAGEYPLEARIELFSGEEPAGGMSLDVTLRVIKKQGDGTS